MAAPVIAVARRAPMEIKRGHLAVLAVLLIAAGCVIFMGVRKVPGGPKVPAAQTENMIPFTPPPAAPVVGPDQHLNGVVYTPLRYPTVCGQEVSALIQNGWGTLRLPHARDIVWLTQPPSEATL